MIERCIYSIDPNDICAQFLEKRDISGTASLICQRICEGCIIRSCAIGADILLICNSTDEELGPVLVEEMGALKTMFISYGGLGQASKATHLDDDRGEISSN